DRERGVELDARALGDGGRVIGLAIGMRRRAGDVVAPRVGRGEEERVVDVTLGDLLRAHDAAEGGEARRHRPAAVLLLRAGGAPPTWVVHVTGPGRPIAR